MTIVTALGHRVNTTGGSRLFTAHRVDARVGHYPIGRTCSPQHVQAHPSKHCRCVGAVRGRSSHYDPRCSLECHKRHAWKESMLLARHLERLPGHVRLYAVTLNVFGLVELGAFLAIFKSFREGIRKRFGNSVKFRPVTEVGLRSGRLHSHIVMTSDGVEVTKADVESIWRDACGNRRIQVDHKPLWDIAGWCRYMWKDGWKWHDLSDPKNCVVLFAKGSPKLPQATPGFFPGKVKAALWEEWKANEAKKRRRASEVVETASGTAVPPGNNPATYIRINTGESTVKSRAPEPVETPSGTVAPLIEPKENAQINTRESMVFNRAPEVVDLSSGTVVPRDEPTADVVIRPGFCTYKSRVTGQLRPAWMRLSHRNHGAVGHARRYRGDFRASIGQRPVSHRRPSELRSIVRTAERRSDRLLGRQARAP